MHTSPFSVNKLRLAFIAFWFIWTALQAIVVQRLGFDWSISIADGITFNTILAIACFLVSNNLRYYLPQQDRYWYILLWSIGFSAVSIFTGRWVLMRFFDDHPFYATFLVDSLLIRSAVAFLMIGCMATISVLCIQCRSGRRMSSVKRMQKGLRAKQNFLTFGSNCNHIFCSTV